MDHESEELRRQMHRFLDHIGRQRYFAGHLALTSWQPAVDIYETARDVVVVVDLAGVDPQTVDIAIAGRTLRLAGKRVLRVQSRRFHQLEIPFGDFERVMNLPAPVNHDEASAQYHDGLLEIALPISQPVHPRVASGPVSDLEGSV